MPQLTGSDLDRLRVHEAALTEMGVTSLSEEGTLEVSGTVVVATPGVTTPRTGPTYGTDVVCHDVLRAQSGIFTSTPQIDARQVVARRPPAHLVLDRSYWAAATIVLALGTTVVLADPLARLTILTQELIVGEDVTFTWQRPPRPAPAEQPGTAPAGADGPLEGSWGEEGGPGAPGLLGRRGIDGRGGPTIELWTLDLQGRPAFDVRGQTGGQGGQGGPGGPGGRGARGRPSHSTTFDCRRGPGTGGRGGPGGQGGTGGRGGDGGDGGRFELFAPQEVVTAYSDGFLIEPSGGAGGSGGDPGVPGQGGPGGEPGRAGGRCKPDDDRYGPQGSTGPLGQRGLAGAEGRPAPQATRFSVIERDEFEQALTAPAVTGLNRQAEGPSDVLPARQVRTSDVVVVHGLRFALTDQVFVAGVPASTVYVSDTLLQITVPAVWGGSVEVRVHRADGTRSNPDTLVVLPVLTGVHPAERIVPGTVVTLTGSGFAPGSRVSANGQDLADAVVIAPERLEVVLVRPAAVGGGPLAEEVQLRLVLPTGEQSAAVTVLLDTYRIVVLGDSVSWGQGLEEAQRASSLVAAAVQRGEGRGVHVHSRAHSGATIGVGDLVILPPLPGEVPTSYPTVLQQVEGYTDDPAGVELVLISAGINDIDVRRILDPTYDPRDLDPRVLRHCHDDMQELLSAALRRFSTAQVVVTGYFPILSRSSNLGLVEPLLAAMRAAGSATGGLGLLGLDRILTNCAWFHERSDAALRSAVEEVNAAAISLGAVPRVAFATAPFTAQNAALAPQAWLYGLDVGLGLGTDVLRPEDHPAVAGPRWSACQVAGEERTDQLTCRLASVGHPNPEGARQYAEAILAALAAAPAPPPAAAPSPELTAGLPLPAVLTGVSGQAEAS